MNILLVGDVFGILGRHAFIKYVKKLREDEQINFIVANGENVAHGTGINEKYYKWFLEQSVNVVTLGNHAFHNKDVFNFIADAKSLIRPLNFPATSPGKGYVTINYNGTSITVFQVMGKVFSHMELDCPFQATEKLLSEVKSDIFICDIHAEATSEKIAFGHHFDGRIHVMFGTHTHVQTNDARVLPKGSFYITDLGMTGPLDGVIGVKKEIVINRFLVNDLTKFEPVSEGKSQFSAVLVDINDQTKKINKIKLLHYYDS
jgi:metallophosphoesterase (TIGR00282 family)